MQNAKPLIWEDDEYFYVSSAAFKHLPPEFRAAAEIRQRQGLDVLKIADKDIQAVMAIGRR
ncbi:hypothetical protein GCM10007989_13940 [Devosia pacifica]|jgi:hypothetical protein|uniref:Uncharacterized protein n=1 Tax=Devosia pacifica TaxID=1335967 RepID=A0A918S3A5_9HYPH|nr:hypothetical protein GCM10007989_13940 [Devosia pacifica]|tara:strand:+ start:785 stop:967 length:183 start_codon:yes stop_codon:yes gene_type:complete